MVEASRRTAILNRDPEAGEEMGRFQGDTLKFSGVSDSGGFPLERREIETAAWLLRMFLVLMSRS